MDVAFKDKKYLDLLLREKELALMESILALAKEFHFTKYTSTLVAAWKVSIEGLTNSILETLEGQTRVPELDPDEDYCEDPMSKFAVFEARQHRKRGVNLSMFLGLFKYYRQVYMDLLYNKRDDFENYTAVRVFVKRCFDRMEIAFCSEWAGSDSEKQIHELSETNLYMTSQKNQLLSIFDTISFPMIFVDELGYIKKCNRSAQSTFYLKGDPGDYYYREETRKIFDRVDFLEHELHKLVEEKRNVWTFEKSIRNVDYRISCTKVLDINFNIVGYTILFVDISDLKEIESTLIMERDRADRANRSKSTFLASMSHDIRTPMTSILGFTEFLQEMNIPEEGKKYITMIEKNGQYLLKLLSDILDLAKAEADRLVLENSSFDLKMMIDEVIEFMKRGPYSKKIDCVFNFPEGMTRWRWGDPVRVKQVLFNLITNAFKYTLVGSITISVVESEGKVQVSVQDTGIGIPPESLETIFDTFSRLEDVTTRDTEGAGLGLSICKKFAHLMKGDISVESIVGRGSKFSFSLELPVSKEVDRLNEDENIPAVVPSFKGKRILIAEDSEDNILLLQAILKPTEATVECANNGIEALEKFRDNEYDLIIMDIQMPVLNGRRATQEIRKTNQDIPVMALTAFAEKSEHDLCKSVGFNETITKPVKKGELYRILSRMFEN